MIFVLVVAVALIAAASVFADQAVERNATPGTPKAKPEADKTDVHCAGNRFFGNPRVDLRGPLSEGFEGGAIPADWTVYNEDGDIYEWEAYSTTDAHGGSYVARVHYNSSGCDDWLITPKLSVVAGDSLKFWAYSYSSSYLEDFEVLLSTTGSAVGDFTTQLDAVTSTPYDWTEYTYDLTTYDG
ncbi:choice-of-anchor J domain-containing protein, partial [bacterium]|nr:choice-of-anchor J domain-containing protein [bacterium]